MTNDKYQWALVCALEGSLTVCSDNCGAPRLAFLRVDEDVTSHRKRAVDELARAAHVLQQVLVVGVVHRDAHVLEARVRLLRWHCVVAHRDYVRDAAIREPTRSLSRSLEAETSGSHNEH